MSERCTHCHKDVRNACSRYPGRARVQALQSCSNMSEVDRYREAASCDGATSDDRGLAICMALKALCGGEPSLMEGDLSGTFSLRVRQSQAPFDG